MRIPVRTSLACIAQDVCVQLYMLEFEDRNRLYIAHCEGNHLVKNVPASDDKVSFFCCDIQ